MATILSALVPVFLIIALGVFLRRTLLPEASHWAALEKLTYFVLFPALLIVSAVKADLSHVQVAKVMGVIFLAILAISALLITVRRPLCAALGVDGPAFTSLFQGATRWNTYIVLAVAGGLYGAEGITIAAVALVSMIPVVNIFCVVVLAYYGSTGGAPTARGVGVQLARNPFIWACGLGAVINFFAIPVPAVVLEFGDILGRASLATGLLVVGGGLALKELKRIKPIVALAVALKLLVKPAIAIAIGLALGLSAVELPVVAIMAAVPSAPNGYVLARQMGGDAPLLAEILTLQIIGAALTLPLVVALAQMLAR